MIVAWDAGKTTFRHSTYTEYKGGRQKTPPELSEQFPYIRKLIEAFGFTQYELDLYEADDIIGTLSRQCSDAEAEVVIISGDKDLTQLANDQTTVCITRKGITDIEKYTPAHIEGEIWYCTIADHRHERFDGRCIRQYSRCTWNW